MDIAEYYNRLSAEWLAAGGDAAAIQRRSEPEPERKAPASVVEDIAAFYDRLSAEWLAENRAAEPEAAEPEDVEDVEDVGRYRLVFAAADTAHGSRMSVSDLASILRDVPAFCSLPRSVRSDIVERCASYLPQGLMAEARRVAGGDPDKLAGAVQEALRLIGVEVRAEPESV